MPGSSTGDFRYIGCRKRVAPVRSRSSEIYDIKGFVGIDSMGLRSASVRYRMFIRRRPILCMVMEDDLLHAGG